MPLPADYHMHTPLCRHAVGEPAEYAARALELGLTEIGFSDHNPMARDDFDDWRMRLADLDAYVEKVQKARLEHPQLIIKLALEVDYLPGYEDWVRDLASRHPWDYLIGSVHYLSNQWAIDNPATIADWRRADVTAVWGEYCQLLQKAVDSGLFNIIGHLDLCKKFGFYPPGEWSQMFAPVLKAAAGTGAAIELNTAGLRKDCRSIYPDKRILQMAASLGIPITFGSDAHAPGEVGMNFAEAVTLARQCGFKSWTKFTARRGEPVPIR